MTSKVIVKMTDSIITKLLRSAMQLLIYKPENAAKPFLLAENTLSRQPSPTGLASAATGLDATLRVARRVETALDQTKNILINSLNSETIQAVQKEIHSLEKQTEEISPLLLTYTSSQSPEAQKVSASLKENAFRIHALFELPNNNDYILRRFYIPMSPPVEAAILFSKSLVDKKDINSTVLTPLLNAKNIDSRNSNLLTVLATQVLPINQVQVIQEFQAISRAVQAGDTVLFVDGSDGAVIIETKGFEHRAIGTPRIEQTVRGSQSSFTETLLINLSLVRLNLRSPDLMADIIAVGKRSHTECAVMYVKSIANPRLVEEIKRRINNISTDIVPAGTLSFFIEDHPNIPFPQSLSTERPDRVSAHLAEGRIAILIDGDPFALVVPISLFTLFQSPEDFAMKPPWGTFMRMLRFEAAMATVIIPSLYIALCYYHLEGIPTDLAVAIAGSRELIPFPAIVEVIVMELSFEFIREAGTRKPGLLGETIGIVGGIILGQAVVAANLISPITVVVVAITGVASFAIPDYITGAAIRMVRFVFLFLAAIMGLVGVASGLIVITTIFCYMHSFGVPFFSPLAPRTTPGFDSIVRGPVFRQERRPDELNTLDTSRQPSLSRRWLLRTKRGGKSP